MGSIAPQFPLSHHKQIIGLDALRVLAACIVVAFHYGFINFSPGSNSDNVPIHAFDFMQRWTSFGWVGVQIFFVLSGFVIAYSAYSAKPWPFLRQRLTRLVPALAFCSFITAAFTLLFHQLKFSTALRITLNSLTFRPGTVYIDPAHWTLSLEMSFYLLCFLLLLFRKGAYLSLILGVLGCISATYNICNYFQSHLSPAVLTWTVHLVQNAPLRQSLFLRHGCYFTIGVYLWLCLFRAVTWPRILVLCFTFTSALFEIVLRSHEVSMLAELPVSPIAPVVAWIVAIGLIIYATRSNAALHAFLHPAVAVQLRHAGLISYPFYLVHMTVGKILVCQLTPHIGALPSLALTVCAVLGAAYVIAIYTEPPAQAWLRKFLTQSGTHLVHTIALYRQRTPLTLTRPTSLPWHSFRPTEPH